MPERQLGKELPEKVAVVVASGLTSGQAANIASCLAAGLAASHAGWAGHALVDAYGFKTAASSHLPIAVLSAPAETLSSLVKQLATAGPQEMAGVALFPAYAQSVHDFAEYQARHSQARHVDELMLGIGLAGPKRWVNRLIGSLPLWR